MVNKKVRKIWHQGESKAIALPPDWLKGHENIENVELCYDGAILIFPEGFPEGKKQRLLEALEPAEE